MNLGGRARRKSPDSEAEVVARLRDRLATVFEIERIVLFGSRAKGHGGAESDWDVLVMAQSSVPFIERQGLAMRAIGPRDFALDLLLYTPEEAQAAASLLGSAVYWAEREGREVHAR